MYYAQIIGTIVEDVKINNNNIVSRLQITHNRTKFYIQLIFKLSDKYKVEKYIKKNSKVFVSGQILKSIYKKNNIQYTNESMDVDKFELIECSNLIEDIEIDKPIEDNYNDF